MFYLSTSDPTTALCGLYDSIGRSLLVLLILFLLMGGVAAQNHKQRFLELGKPIELELAGGESDSFQIVVESNQYIRVIVDQRGIDVMVRLFGPDGKQMIEKDSPNGTRGPESVTAIVDSAGSYRLDVRSLKKDIPRGRCEVKLEARHKANGREIDTFAELAQRLGAGGVMASLWAVREKSTAELMNAFYRKRQGGHFSKEEGLRQAQLDLLYGRNLTLQHSNTADPVPATKGNNASDEEVFVEPKYRIPFKLDKKKPFAHPYYWAPFVLFGNWK